jgi:hypothetical protein
MCPSSHNNNDDERQSELNILENFSLVFVNTLICPL